MLCCEFLQQLLKRMSESRKTEKNQSWGGKKKRRSSSQRKKERKSERHTETEKESEREVVTDTFSGSGTQKALPTRPPVEHEATRGV